MNKNKIGICTIYTGFNYGSALQAFAVKKIVLNMGYYPIIFKVKGSIFSGRDIRLNKIITILLRKILHPFQTRGILKTYFKNPGNNVPKKTIDEFLMFYKTKIEPESYSWSQLKLLGKNDDFFAFIAGSDQIWNGANLYVDPFYYLKFTIKDKKIALAPSFGADFIPKYNTKIIKKNLQDFNFISAREESGIKIIRDLTGRNASQLCDPTLFFSKEEWIKMMELDVNIKANKYVLLYFLSPINDRLYSKIKAQYSKYELININELQKDIGIGPKEFLNYILNAELVLTDSFHGTVFSIIFNKKFYAFKRNYEGKIDQSTRLTSLLSELMLLERFESHDINFNEISYNNVNLLLTKFKDKIHKYLENAFFEIKEKFNEN